MSEPIQAISQGNYILHNIDAKKLYVQEPLFTANSGDAVYVGWRPDETVLWSGTGSNVATLSESMQNFSRLKIKLGNQDGTDGTQYFEFPAQPSAIKNLSYQAGGGANFYFVGLYCSATDTSITITKEAAVIKPFGNTTVNGQNTNAVYSAAFHEVIGINRKENA